MRSPITVALVGLFTLFGSSVVAAAPIQQAQASSRPSSGEEPEVISARVVQVFKVTDGKYASITYQIIWHDQQVIVEDAIHSTDYKVGDTMEVLILRHDMSTAKEPNGAKLIHFQVFPRFRNRNQKSEPGG